MDSPNSPKPYCASATTFDTLLVDDGPQPRKKRDAVPLKLKLTQFRQSVWGLREWKEAGLAAVEDLLVFSWIPAIVWLVVLLWLSGLLTLLITIGRDPNQLVSSGTACQPDGTFSVYENSFNIWHLSSSAFFQTTLAWGTLTFGNAKLIDVAWDVVFGRGGQALIAWISWSVFSDYVTTSIQVSPITYETFWAFFLREQPGAFSTWYIVRDFSRYHGLRSRTVMVFMVLVAIFVLIFPTFAGAMTGYSANSGSFVRSQDGGLVKFSDFDLVLYVIHDGWRVGLSGGFPVTLRRTYERAEQMIRHSSFEGWMPGGIYGTWCDESSWQFADDSMKLWEKKTPLNERCTLHSNVTKYVKEHGFFGLEDKESTFMNINISAPTLNIEPIWIPDGLKDDYYGRNWTDPRTGELIKGLSDMDSMRWASIAGNESYSLDYINANGTCQPLTENDINALPDAPMHETYQWGFSFIQLYIMTILLTLWTVGMALLWLKAHLTMRMRGRYDVPKGFKGVLELAAHVRKELAETDPDELTHAQLGEEIRKRLKGGSIELESAGSPAMYGLWRGFWGWCRERRGMSLSFVAFIVPACVLIYIRELFGWYLLTWACSVVLTMVIGRSPSSRLVLLLGWAFLGSILFLAIWRTKVQKEDFGPDWALGY